MKLHFEYQVEGGANEGKERACFYHVLKIVNFLRHLSE